MVGGPGQVSLGGQRQQLTEHVAGPGRCGADGASSHGVGGGLGVAGALRVYLGAFDHGQQATTEGGRGIVHGAPVQREGARQGVQGKVGPGRTEGVRITDTGLEGVESWRQQALWGRSTQVGVLEECGPDQPGLWIFTGDLVPLPVPQRSLDHVSVRGQPEPLLVQQRLGGALLVAAEVGVQLAQCEGVETTEDDVTLGGREQHQVEVERVRVDLVRSS